MAIDTPARHIYSGDGSTRVFPIPTYIQGDDYIRIEINGVHQVDRSKWDIVNNSIIFVTAPITTATIDVQVATSVEALAELGSVTNIDIVAGSIAGINEVASKLDELLEAAATIDAVTTKASQWADNNYNVEVEVGKYSAKHWATVAQNTTANKIDKVTSTDNAIVRFNGTTGQVQNSAITIDDVGNMGSGTQTFNGFGGTGFKNYIINGNFDIWQRAASQTSSGYGSDDRWSNETLVSTKTHSLIACTDTERALFNSDYFSKTVVTTGGTPTSLTVKLTKIENVSKLAGKTVTLSFWAKADSNKNIAIEFQQIFGTGGSPSALVGGIGSQLVALTNTWQKKTITVTLPSIIGKTLGTDGAHTSCTRLAFWFEAGSSWSPTYIPALGTQSGTFDIAQVQLEEGSIATPFEQRPVGLELSLCQRYYRPLGRLFGIATTATQMQCFVDIEPMRLSSPNIIVLNATPSGESPISITGRTSQGITPTLAWNATYGQIHITFNGFSGMTGQQSALINGCVALSTEL